MILHHHCPFCGKVFDRVSKTYDFAEPAPVPGDYSLCFTCGEWCVFTDDLGLRKPTDAEYQEIVDDPQTAQIRQAWLIVKGMSDEDDNEVTR